MQKVILDLLPGGVAPIVYASQYDDGRSIRFMLTEGGPDSQYSLNANDVITCNLTKPDGTETVKNVANPGGGEHYVDLVNGADDYDQAGAYLGEIVLTRNARVIGSANFVLKVEEDAYGGQITTLTATGNPCTFSTDLADNAVECKVDIAYNANGYKSALLVNTSNAPSEDSTPYNFRPSFSNGYGYETLIGGTCGVNQLVQNANKSYDNTITESNPSHLFTDIAYPIIENHVYLLHVTDLTNIPTIEPFMQTGWWHKSVVDGYCMLKADTHYGDYGWLGYRSIDQTTPLGTVNIKFDNYFVIDLTAMFGTTIADYVYNLENG